MDNGPPILIKQILQKTNKTENDIGVLHEYLKNIEFFKDFQQNLSPTTYNLLIKSLQFQKSKQNKILFHHQEKGLKVYILLKGEITVLEPKIEKDKSVLNPNYRTYLQMILYYKSYLNHTELKSNNTLRNGLVLSQDEKEKAYLKAMFDQYIKGSIRPQKLTRGKAILGYWLCKVAWNREGPGNNEGEKEPIDTFSKPYVVKSYWTNFFISSLPKLEPGHLLDVLFPSLKVTNTLKPKTAFGQLALQTPGGLRQASIICSSDCEFAVLVGDGTLGGGWLGRERQRLKDKLEVSSLFTSFGYWLRKGKLNDLLPFMNEGTLGRGRFIYRRGRSGINNQEKKIQGYT